MRTQPGHEVAGKAALRREKDLYLEQQAAGSQSTSQVFQRSSELNVTPTEEQRGGHSGAELEVGKKPSVWGHAIPSQR